jgi:acetyl esterase/lipase
VKKKYYSFFILLVVSSFLKAQETNSIIYLWKNGAPGFEARKEEKEIAKDWWVKNIHNPSLTVYLPPKEKANGAAVVIMPGGGFRTIVFNAEGKEAAEYLNSIGVAAFVLKYRLFRDDNSPYKAENALQDGRRAIRLVRQQAATWNLDTTRIGLMGFSAGGELATWTALNSDKEPITKPDKIDKQKCKADFLILVYPGPLNIPDSISKDAPPIFMVAANDDECCSEPIVKLLKAYRKANVKVEVHLFAQGNHAFNMGTRSKLKSIYGWPQRMSDWLFDNEFIKK